MLKKMGNNNLVRLQKFMAECGVASRRKSEELIEMGKVKVNGHVAHIGDKINPKKDIVAVRGKKITKEERMYYIMLNKPRGYVTTVSDELGRKTVMDLVDCDARVYPVGRLDKDSEGLLILTNDGSFANALTHPKHNYAKVYRVTVRPSVNDEMLEKMRNGIEIDGRKTAPCDINIISEEEGRVVLGTGWVNESDLCFLGGFPGPLTDALGIWAEEIDVLMPGMENSVQLNGNTYKLTDYAELIHLRTAKQLTGYDSDFYAGTGYSRSCSTLISQR